MARKVGFVVTRMDDFDVVFGMEFLLTHYIMHVPASNYPLIMGENLSIMLVQTKQFRETKLLSTL